MTYRTNLALTLSVLFLALSATGTVASAQQNLDSVACVASELEYPWRVRVRCGRT